MLNISDFLNEGWLLNLFILRHTLWCLSWYFWIAPLFNTFRHLNDSHRYIGISIIRDGFLLLMLMRFLRWFSMPLILRFRWFLPWDIEADRLLRWYFIDWPFTWWWRAARWPDIEWRPINNAIGHIASDDDRAIDRRAIESSADYEYLLTFLFIILPLWCLMHFYTLST